MINRKQAAELLSSCLSSRHSPTTLEAVYSAGDDVTKALLNAHPDLRLKAANAAEAYVRAAQEEKDYKAAVNALRDALDPDIVKQRQAMVQMRGDDQCESPG